MLQDEYYIIRRENNDLYPLIAWDEVIHGVGIGKPVGFNEPIKLKLGDPLNDGFQLVDYHSFPVISKLLFNVLAPMGLYGVQLVLATVRNPYDSGYEIPDYWFMHVWNQIACADLNKSDADYDEVDGMIWDFNRLVLDEKTLNMFELRKRLIFELDEDAGILLIHQTIKDAIESVHSKGCRFFRVDEYNDAIDFT